MTVALTVVLVVALALVGILLWRDRSRAGVLAAEKAKGAENEARAGQTSEITQRFEQRVAELERRAQVAERRAEIAERRAGDADGRADGGERRAEAAERRVAEVESRLAAAEQRAVTAERVASGSAAGRSLWDTERVRIEREWADVAGPGVPLPVAWDGTFGAAAAAELAIIREVIGTPSDLEVEGELRPADSLGAALAARIGSELLRVLARSGEEMTVTVRAGGLSVVQPADAAAAPALTLLQAAAQAAGAELAFDVSDDRVSARLTVSTA